MTCTECGGERLREARAWHSLEVAGHTFRGNVAAMKCARCDAVLLSGTSLERFELEVAGALADAGEHSGEVFKFMRKAVGMRAADLASYLGVAPETISRWETGARTVDRCALVVVGALVGDARCGSRTTLERLERLSEPRSLPKVVKLDSEPREKAKVTSRSRNA